MKKIDEQLDKLIIEAIKYDFEQAPEPPMSKEEAWAEIEKQLKKQRKIKNPYNPLGLAVAILALFIIGAAFFNTSQTTAFGWIKELFISQKGDSLYLQGGARPVDDPNMNPPQADQFEILNGVSTTQTVSIMEAVEIANFNVYTPTYLPEGYVEKQATVYCFNDTCNNVFFSYKNENGNELIIKQQYFEGAYGKGEGIANVVETKTVSVNGVQATLVITSHENLKFLKWSKHNIEFSIDGYLSEEELLKVGKSLTVQ